MKVKTVKGALKALEGVSHWLKLYQDLSIKPLYVTKEKVKLDFENLTYVSIGPKPINKKSIKVERSGQLIEALQKMPAGAVLRTPKRIPGNVFEYVDNSVSVSHVSYNHMFEGRIEYISIN